jgi:endoglucanase
LIEVANANEIPFKVTAYAGATGTNAWAMQVVQEGIPTGLIDIPLRYMHTSVETLNLNDLERIGRLMALFCAALDDKFVRELRGDQVEPEKEISKKGKEGGRRRQKAKK